MYKKVACVRGMNRSKISVEYITETETEMFIITEMEIMEMGIFLVCNSSFTSSTYTVLVLYVPFNIKNELFLVYFFHFYLSFIFLEINDK